MSHAVDRSKENYEECLELAYIPLVAFIVLLVGVGCWRGLADGAVVTVGCGLRSRIGTVGLIVIVPAPLIPPKIRSGFCRPFALLATVCNVGVPLLWSNYRLVE
jgi:hypothetical protein